MQVYLLSIEAFADERMYRRAFSFLDDTQKQKVQQYGQPLVRFRSLGAELLLQLAMAERERDILWVLDQRKRQQSRAETEPDWETELADAGAHWAMPGVKWSFLDPGEVLAGIGTPRKVSIRYGKRGKPYFSDDTFYFNKSHTGNFAALAWGMREVGVDIQQIYPGREESIAMRFFSDKEKAAMNAASAERKSSLFYKIWSRKEAYGKLIGSGLTEIVFGYNVLSEDGRTIFTDYDMLPGYHISVCTWREGLKV